MLSIDQETTDAVIKVLNDVPRPVGDASRKLFATGPIPPGSIRWFILAYIVALFVSIPSSGASMLRAGGFFLACGLGLVAIAKFRRQRLNSTKNASKQLHLVKASPTTTNLR